MELLTNLDCVLFSTELAFNVYVANGFKTWEEILSQKAALVCLFRKINVDF